MHQENPNSPYDFYSFEQPFSEVDPNDTSNDDPLEVEVPRALSLRVFQSFRRFKKLQGITLPTTLDNFFKSCDDALAYEFYTYLRVDDRVRMIAGFNVYKLLLLCQKQRLQYKEMIGKIEKPPTSAELEAQKIAWFTRNNVIADEIQEEQFQEELSNLKATYSMKLRTPPLPLSF